MVCGSPAPVACWSRPGTPAPRCPGTCGATPPAHPPWHRRTPHWPGAGCASFPSAKACPVAERGLEPVFFRHRRTVSGLMRSTISLSTNWSASRCIVQPARPLGGWEQAKATRWASPAPSSFLGRRFSCSLRPRALSKPSSTHRRRTRSTVAAPTLRDWAMSWSLIAPPAWFSSLSSRACPRENGGYGREFACMPPPSGHHPFQFLLFLPRKSHTVFLDHHLNPASQNSRITNP